MKCYYLNSSEFNIVCDLLDESSSGIIRYSGLIVERLFDDLITCVYESEVLTGDFEWMELVED